MGSHYLGKIDWLCWHDDDDDGDKKWLMGQPEYEEKKKSTDSVSLNALCLLKWVLSRRKRKVGETNTKTDQCLRKKRRSNRCVTRTNRITRIWLPTVMSCNVNRWACRCRLYPFILAHILAIFFTEGANTREGLRSPICKINGPFDTLRPQVVTRPKITIVLNDVSNDSSAPCYGYRTGTVNDTSECSAIRNH